MPPHTKSTTTVVASTEDASIAPERVFHPMIVSHTETQFTDRNNNNDEKISAQVTKEDFYEPTPLVRSFSVATEKYEPHIRWPDLMAQLFLHSGFLYGLYFLLTGQVKFYTYIWGT